MLSATAIIQGTMAEPSPLKREPRWEIGELPEPPPATWKNVSAILGPGAILLSFSLGAGEWLLGPAVVAKHGVSLLWLTTVSCLLQLFLNMECVRYALATGEPIWSGILRLRPGPGYWAWFWTVMTMLQAAWTGWAGAAAGAVAAFALGKPPTHQDSGTVAWLGIAVVLASTALLMAGRRAERVVEAVNRVMALFTLALLAVAALFLVPPRRWVETLGGFLGWGAGGFIFLPPEADFFLLGAFAAYSGSGGIINATVSSWARDKGFGMGAVVGFTEASVGDQTVRLTREGKLFALTAETLRKWSGWWKLARVDQVVFWFGGAIAGMALTGTLAAAFLPAGSEIRGVGVAAELPRALSIPGGQAVWFLTLLVGFWILFSTQLGVLDALSRLITDLLWSGSRTLRSRVSAGAIYWGALGAMTAWGLLSLGAPLAGFAVEPIVLLQLGANWAGVNFVILSLQVLRVNRTLLPPEVRPSLWRQIALLLCAAFFLALAGAWLLLSQEGQRVILPVIGFFALAALAGTLSWRRC
jgi:Mn2+/Fe2+ NRAMP family transporter